MFPDRYILPRDSQTRYREKAVNRSLGTQKVLKYDSYSFLLDSIENHQGLFSQHLLLLLEIISELVLYEQNSERSAAKVFRALQAPGREYIFEL